MLPEQGQKPLHSMFICFALGYLQQLNCTSRHGHSSGVRCQVGHCQPVTSQSHCIGGEQVAQRTPRRCTGTSHPPSTVPQSTPLHARWRGQVGAQASACHKTPPTKPSTSTAGSKAHLYVCFKRCLLAGRDRGGLPPGHVRAVYPADRCELCYGVAVLQQRAQRPQERDALRVRGEPGVPARRACQVR